MIMTGFWVIEPCALEGHQLDDAGNKHFWNVDKLLPHCTDDSRLQKCVFYCLIPVRFLVPALEAGFTQLSA
jgi:hypothetical protein